MARNWHMTPEQRERASEAAKLRWRREQVWQPPPCCAQLYTEILGKFGSNHAAELRRIIEDHHRVRCERVKEPA